MMFFRIISIGLLVCASGVAAPPAQADLTAKNYREWIDYIRPSDDEQKWLKVSWRNRLMPAVEEAKRLDRPVLLWAMNGNPCGET